MEPSDVVVGAAFGSPGRQVCWGNPPSNELSLETGRSGWETVPPPPPVKGPKSPRGASGVGHTVPHHPLTYRLAHMEPSPYGAVGRTNATAAVTRTAAVGRSVGRTAPYRGFVRPARPARTTAGIVRPCPTVSDRQLMPSIPIGEMILFGRLDKPCLGTDPPQRDLTSLAVSMLENV